MVIKTSRFGYDGKGQRIIRQRNEIEEAASQFNNIPIIIEEMINFELEMSVIICRDIYGKISAYDPSENVHKNGILIESKVPGNISLSIASDAIIIANSVSLPKNFIQVRE